MAPVIVLMSQHASIIGSLIKLIFDYLPIRRCFAAGIGGIRAWLAGPGGRKNAGVLHGCSLREAAPARAAAYSRSWDQGPAITPGCRTGFS
jgi:hypothetical protein